MGKYIIEVREFDSEAICDLRGCSEAADKKATRGIELDVKCLIYSHS